MKSNLLIGLLSLLFLGSLNAGRLAEVVKEGRHSSTSSLLEPSVEQMLDQVQTPSSEKMSREDFLKKQREEIDEDSFDKKKEPGFFDRLSSLHKVAMAVVGLVALTGIAGAAFKAKDAIGEFTGLKKLADSFKDHSLRDLQEGLDAPEDQIVGINGSDNQMKKLGVRLKKGEQALALLNELAPQIREMTPKVNALLSDAQQIKPAVMGLVRGLGVPDEQLKTNGQDDLSKATQKLGEGLRGNKVKYSVINGTVGFDLSGEK